MADFKQFFPTLMQYEGGSKLTNIPGDAGGWTKWGITLLTWEQYGQDKDSDGDIDLEDLKISTVDDAEKVAKFIYWDKVGGDMINSQSVAEFLFDWAYNSGPSTAVKHIQSLVGTQADGVIGLKTIAAINAKDSKSLFEQLKEDRRNFFRHLVVIRPVNQKFIKGWLNRVDSFTFKS